jgi:hypothetical protein
MQRLVIIDDQLKVKGIETTLPQKINHFSDNEGLIYDKKWRDARMHGTARLQPDLSRAEAARWKGNSASPL